MRWALSLTSSALLAGLAAASCSSEDAASQEATAECSEALGYEDFAGPFFLNWCTGCHSSSLTEGQRQEAPLGIDFDSLDDIRAHRERIVARAVESHAMPPAGGPSEAERKALGRWFACGAPASTQGFEPPPAPPTSSQPGPTGQCAAPKQALPAAVLPRCSATTFQCVQNCAANKDEDEVDDCREACQAADTTPPDMSLGFPISCSTCTFQQAQACAEQAGCRDSVAAMSCCIEDCAKQSDPGACFQTECRDEILAFAYCVYYGDASCLDHAGPWLGACYAGTPAPGLDAGADAASSDGG